MKPTRMVRNQGIDRSFKTKFDSHVIVFPKVNFTPTEFTVDMKTGKPDQEDIYYDEIVYYDGGGVEGYGD